VEIARTEHAQAAGYLVLLVAGGTSNAKISELLGTREATVRSHLKNMRNKRGVTRPEGLLLAAVGLDGAPIP